MTNLRGLRHCKPLRPPSILARVADGGEHRVANFCLQEQPAAGPRRHRGNALEREGGAPGAVEARVARGVGREGDAEGAQAGEPRTVRRSVSNSAMVLVGAHFLPV